MSLKSRESSPTKSNLTIVSPREPIVLDSVETKTQEAQYSEGVSEEEQLEDRAPSETSLVEEMASPPRPYSTPLLDYANSKAVEFQPAQKTVETIFARPVKNRRKMMETLTREFIAILDERFGHDLQRAFRFFDNVTFNRSGRVSLLKFTVGCEQLGWRDDIKLIFHVLDKDNDGIISIEDLNKWK